MATLIGAGGHAQDIAATGYYRHHHGHHNEVEGWSAFWLFAEPVVVGVNDPHLRAAIAEDLGINDQEWVHPRAFIGPGCKIGAGTHVNYGVTMTRTTLGHHCTIAPGVTICGDVTIGDRVFIGAGAVIRNLISIGDDAFICMGSIVTRDVAPGERYKGRT